MCPQSMFYQKYKNIRILFQNFQFLVVKFSVYLNRRVFVNVESCLGTFEVKKGCKVLHEGADHLNEVSLLWALMSEDTLYPS